MQTITTLDQAAHTIQQAFPDAHVNLISDTGIEVYIGLDAGDTFSLIEQATVDNLSGEETTGWTAREGWIDATDGFTQHLSEVAPEFDTLTEAVDRAIENLRNA